MSPRGRSHQPGGRFWGDSIPVTSKPTTTRIANGRQSRPFIIVHYGPELRLLRLLALLYRWRVGHEPQDRADDADRGDGDAGLLGTNASVFQPLSMRTSIGESTALTAGRMSRFAPQMTAPRALRTAGGKGRKQAERLRLRSVRTRRSIPDGSAAHWRAERDIADAAPRRGAPSRSASCRRDQIDCRRARGMRTRPRRYRGRRGRRHCDHAHS